MQLSFCTKEVSTQADSVLNMSALDRMKILREGKNDSEMREHACDHDSVALLHMFAKPSQRSDMYRWAEMFSAIDLGLRVYMVAVACGTIECRPQYPRKHSSARLSTARSPPGAQRPGMRNFLDRLDFGILNNTQPP